MNSTVTLTDLLPSTAYILAYTLPLLFLSFLLTFAGAFLTLDRTRSFAPRNDVLQIPASFDVKQKEVSHFYLEGGIGGLAIGYVFGLHLSTFLSLLIPNNTSSPSLTSKSFVAVWLLSSLPVAILGGRFSILSLALGGITGGTSLALALSIALHPSLLTRRILFALLLPVLVVLTILPFDRTRYASLRLSASASGAFGIIMSIALLAQVPAWGNTWERLWISDGNNWDTSAEHGLSAGFWLILTLGCLADWTLRRIYGANPDQKWDSYLADYTTALPNSSNRSGTFQPLSSFWDRLFRPSHRSSPSSSVLFSTPGDDSKHLQPSLPNSRIPTMVHQRDFALEKAPVESSLAYNQRPGVLRKHSQRPLARIMALASTEGTAQRRREAVKFRPVTGTMSDFDSDSDDDASTKIDDALSASPPKRRLSTHSSMSKTLTDASTSHTFARHNEDKALSSEDIASPSYIKKNGRFDDSDDEEDVTVSAAKRSRDTPGWSPPFLMRAGSTKRQDTPPGAVPMTPSLIHALDRIAVAQENVFKPQGMPISSSRISPTRAKETAVVQDSQWDSFWHDVRQKAGDSMQHKQVTGA